MANRDRCSCSRWFFYSAIVQGAMVFLTTIVLFVYGSLYLKPTPAQVIASGSAGTWLVVGYSVYILMVLYLGVTSFFYYLLEADSRGKIGRVYDILTGLHLFFANFGIIGTSFLLMRAGYAGGAGLLNGLTALQVHEQILGVYPPVVIAFVLATMFGALCGGLSYILALAKRRR